MNGSSSWPQGAFAQLLRTALFYHTRYDEGVFVGSRFCGSPLHVDQVSWSNIGKNFKGAKLLAIWEAGEHPRISVSLPPSLLSLLVAELHPTSLWYRRALARAI